MYCRALHERETRQKGGLTRLQFFLLVFASSFAYYLVPGYLFQGISAISIVCLVWKKSVLAQQIGSGMSGLGIGSFGLDWNSAGMVGNPISVPPSAIINLLIGFALIMYIMAPLTYYLNIYDAKNFPIFSGQTFDHTGKKYNISRVLNERTFSLNVPAYEEYSKVYLSAFFALSYGLGFAVLSATIIHVVLYHGK